MIAVRVDRPVRENQVGLLGFQHLAKVIVPARAHLGAAIDLTGEDRSGLQDLAGFVTLGGANHRGLLMTLALDSRLAPRQIEGHNLVPKVGVPRHRSAAA